MTMGQHWPIAASFVLPTTSLLLSVLAFLTAFVAAAIVPAEKGVPTVYGTVQKVPKVERLSWIQKQTAKWMVHKVGTDQLNQGHQACLTILARGEKIRSHTSESFFFPFLHRSTSIICPAPRMSLNQPANTFQFSDTPFPLVLCLWTTSILKFTTPSLGERPARVITMKLIVQWSQPSQLPRSPAVSVPAFYIQKLRVSLQMPTVGS